MKYWYLIYKTICDSCGKTVTEIRRRVYTEHMKGLYLDHIPACDDCYAYVKVIR